MHKKRIIGVLVLVLLITSSFTVLAQDECTGFFGTINCFLFGSSENRAGRSWFDRGNVDKLPLDQDYFTFGGL